MLPILLTDTVSTNLDRALHYALMWGHEGLALRTMGRHGEYVPNVNEAKLRHRLDEHEMALAAVEPGLFQAEAGDRTQAYADLGALPETTSFCQRFGCEIVLVGALAGPPGTDPTVGAEILRRAGEVAARHDLVLAVRNQADTACADGAALAALLQAVDHPHVRAAWSPAEAVRTVAEGDASAASIASWAALVVVRDGTGAGEAWVEAVPGEGAVEWPLQLTTLRAAGFGGPLCLEVHGEPTGPFGLQASTALVKLIRAQRRTERLATE